MLTKGSFTFSSVKSVNIFGNIKIFFTDLFLQRYIKMCLKKNTSHLWVDCKHFSFTHIFRHINRAVAVAVVDVADVVI